MFTYMIAVGLYTGQSILQKSLGLARRFIVWLSSFWCKERSPRDSDQFENLSDDNSDDESETIVPDVEYQSYFTHPIEEVVDELSKQSTHSIDPITNRQVEIGLFIALAWNRTRQEKLWRPYWDGLRAMAEQRLRKAMRRRALRLAIKHWASTARLLRREKALLAFKSYCLRKQPEALVAPVANPATAFPKLGSVETCQCLLLQPAEALLARPALIMRALFSDHRLVSNGVWINPDNGSTGVVLKTGGGRLHYLEEQNQPCGCVLFSHNSVLSCHLGDGLGLDGHLPQMHAIVACSRNPSGQPVINNIRFLQPQTVVEYRTGLDDDTELPLCAHVSRVPLKPEALLTDRARSRQVVTATPISSQPTLYLHDRHTEYFEMHILDIEMCFGAKVIGRDWDQAVKEARRLWSLPYPETADKTVLFTEEYAWERAVKRRFKSIYKDLARVGSKYGFKKRNAKSFDAENYQEYLEMSRRRYEDAAILSNSELARSSSQMAQEWLKSQRAKHWMNRIVLNACDNPILARKTLADFNRVFVSMGGKELKMPEQKIAALRAERLKALHLQEKQKAATERREKYIGWLGSQHGEERRDH